MSVKIGISPIAWQNDDLPELTADFTMEQALREARDIGFTGVERGRRMPQDTESLRRFLGAYGLELCGGWCSGNLLARSVAEEQSAISAQVAQFAALGAPCIVYAECSNSVQGSRGTPLAARPKLSAEALGAYAAKLTELARWTAAQGLRLAYHHHMGTIVEDQDDIDRLMEASGPEVALLFDTGHLVFGGADPMTTLDRWGDRIFHVHFKDVRAKVAADSKTRNRSFLDAVIAGAFTVPGDPEGSVDFDAVTARLAALDYSGWIVVEAEQDPAKVAPVEASELGYRTIRELCARHGLDVVSARRATPAV